MNKVFFGDAEMPRPGICWVSQHVNWTLVVLCWIKDFTLVSYHLVQSSYLDTDSWSDITTNKVLLGGIEMPILGICWVFHDHNWTLVWLSWINDLIGFIKFHDTHKLSAYWFLIGYYYQQRVIGWYWDANTRNLLSIPKTIAGKIFLTLNHRVIKYSRAVCNEEEFIGKKTCLASVTDNQLFHLLSRRVSI
jgi:hypothetical protein